MAEENLKGVIGTMQPDGQPEAPPAAGAADQQNLFTGEGDAAAGQRQDVRTVPLAALEDERAKRQAYERELAQTRSQTEFLQELVRKQTEVAQPDVADDEYVSASTVKKLITETMRDFKGELQTRSLQEKVEAARQAHPDFDEAISMATEMIQNAPDPAAAFKALEAAGPEFAYQFGKTHPKLSQSRTVAETQERLSRINKNINQTATLTDVGGAGMVGSFEDQLNRTSKAERDRIWDEIKLGKRSFFQ
jgi:hypothetical protein